MTAERIANLNKRIAELETALQASESRHKALQTDLIAPMQSNRLKALAAAYGAYSDTRTPRLMMVLSLLQLGVDAADPLRAAPTTDTMRVGHPELTATEAAVVGYQQARANVTWIGTELERFIDRVQNRLQPDEDQPAKSKPQRPRCHGAHCRGVRGNVGDRYCRNCGAAFKGQEEAA